MEQNLSEIFRYLKMVYKRRHLAIALALLVASAVIGGSYFLPKKYKVDSTVFIEENVIKNLVKGIAVTPDMQDRIKVLRYALLSRGLITRVLADLDVDTTVKNPQAMQALVKSLQERTEINISKGEDQFTVSITDKDPAFAQNFINKLVGKYVEENISAKRDETYGANRFLDEQLVLFKQKLDEAENSIIEFRRQQGVYLSVDENAIVLQIRQHQQQLETLSLDISTLQARKNRLDQQLRGMEPTVALFSEQQSNDRLTTLENRLRQLLLNYTENYPDVVRTKAEIAALRSRGEGAGNEGGTRMTGVNPLYQDARQKIMDVETELSSLGAKKGRLQELVAEKETELQSIPEHAKEFGVLVQVRDSVKKIYEDLLLRMGQSEVSKQMEIGDKTTTFRVVDPAAFPNKPISPNMVKMILLGLAAGFGAGIGVAVLLELRTSSIKDASQLKELGVEVLAVIPHIPSVIEQSRWRRLDRLAYSVATIWGFGFFGLLGFELLRLR